MPDGIEYRKRSSSSKKKLVAITHQFIDQIERRIELESLLADVLLGRLSKIKGLQVNGRALPLPSVQANVFESLIFHAFAEGHIGKSKAAELMGVSLMQFKRLRAMQNTEVLPSAVVGP